jgi:hypothetical protein
VEFKRSQPVSLKAHPEYNEKWLQRVLADDPSLLGLGDLTVKEVERCQPRAGRLDLLLSDPETHTRYEVEIQLGATDGAHIIRTIEYWEIEESRYPQYEHVGVLVAEDITRTGTPRRGPPTSHPSAPRTRRGCRCDRMPLR